MSRRASVLEQLWAVALLTLREATRKKVFTILIIFTGILLSSAFFFPAVDAEARLRLIQLWSLRATTLFTAILAIFVAGFSLPSDMEDRRVYTLLTKPVSKVVFFLGRTLGFALILAIFMFIMAFVSVLYVRFTSAISPGFPDLKAEPQLYADDFRGIEAKPVSLYPDRLVLEGASPDETLIFRFRNLSPSDVPAAARGEVALFVGGRSGFLFSTPVEVMIGGERQNVTANNQSPVEFRFPKTAMKDGTIEVRIRCHNPQARIGADPDSLVIYGASQLYEWNYFKGMIVLYLHSLIILMVTLMASTFMGAPMSILLGIFFFLVHLSHGFVEDAVRDLDRQMEERDRALREGRDAPRTPEDLPPWLLQSSSRISSVALKVIGDHRTYDFSPYLLRDLAITFRGMGAAFADMLVRFGTLLALGVLVMFYKEFE